MKDIQFKCISDPENKFQIKDKILTTKHWKDYMLGFDHREEVKVNLAALSGKDVLDYLSFIYKLKFEKVEKFIF